MKLGVLTGGGDCPGLNPAIRAVVMRALDYGDEIIGLRQGWKGLLDADAFPLTLETVEPIIDQGGTILESSRTNPAKDEERIAQCLTNAEELGLDALIAIGGEDTLGAAHVLAQKGLRCVGVPKTIDNDLNATDYTFGFDSAVAVATDAADRLKDTARSHRRFLVLEVMGRHAGWIALHTGVAAGADWILIPEVPFELGEIIGHVKKLKKRGKHWGLIVASEGVKLPQPASAPPSQTKHDKDDFQHDLLKGVGGYVAAQIRDHASVETREIVLGHVVRGGPPTPFDRWLGTRTGIKAVELVHEGRWDHMAAMQGNQIVGVPLQAAVGELKTVPLALYEEVKTLFSR